MQWVSLLLTLSNGFATLVVWMHERQIISDHDKALIGAAIEKQLLVIKGANDARAEQAKRNAAVPKSDSLPDDGFRRD